MSEYGMAREKLGKSRDEKGQSQDMDAVTEVIRLEGELKALLVLPAIEQRLSSKHKEKKPAA